MKITFSKNGLLYILYTLVFFMPDFIKNIGLDKVEYIFILYFLLLMLSKKYYPQNFIVNIMMFYHVYIFLITLLNGGSLDFIFIFIKNVAYIMIFDFMISKKKEEVLSCIMGILLLYCTIDLLSLIIYPDGIYQTELVWNQWSTSVNAIWFFGGKNGRWFYYAIVINIVLYKHCINKSKRLSRCFLLAAVASVLSAYLEQSATSIVVLIIMSIGIYIALNNQKFISIRFEILPMIIAYFIMQICIFFGQTFFLTYFVQSILHRSMTFSNRTFIWAKAIMEFLKNPILGKGYIGYLEAREIFGSLTYNHAHNQWLQVLLNGGVSLFLVFLYMFINIAKNINKVNNQAKRIGLSLVLLSVLINMIFEVPFTNAASWIILYLINSMAKGLKKSN